MSRRKATGTMRNFLLAAVFIGAVGCDDGGNGEMFPDPAFKACVEDRIAYAVSIGLWQKDDPDIYNKVDELACEGGGVKSLKGIDNMQTLITSLLLTTKSNRSNRSAR